MTVFEVAEFANFGRSDVAKSFQIAAGSGITAIEIDPASEIDACWIQMEGVQTAGGLLGGGLLSDFAYGRQSLLFGATPQIPPGGNAFLSVEHPLVGPVRGTITVQPLYKFDVATPINTAGNAPVAKLSLRLWRVMPAFAVGVTKRGVIRGGWGVGGAGNPRVVVVPTFGRKLMRIWASDAGGPTNLNLDYAWCLPDGSLTFQTATAVVVPASPAFAGVLTSALPNWVTIYDGGNTDTMLVECYD